MSGDNSLRELFPSSEHIAIGGSDPRGTNTIERYQNALIRYGKQSFGIYWEVFRDPLKLPSLPTSSSLLKITEISPIRRVQPSRSMPTNCTY